MLMNPPIDKLIDKVGCKYALVCLISERAKYLLDKKNDLLDNSAERAISMAAQDVFDGRVEAHYEE